MVKRLFIPIRWCDIKRKQLPTALENQRKTHFLTVELRRCEQDPNCHVPWTRAPHRPSDFTQTLPGPLPGASGLRDMRQSEEVRIKTYQAGQLTVSTTVSVYLSVIQLSVSPSIFSLRTKGTAAKASQAIRLFSLGRHFIKQPRHSTERCRWPQPDEEMVLPGAWDVSGFSAAMTSPPRKNPVLFRFILCTALGIPYTIFLKYCLFPAETETGKGPAVFHFIVS